MLSAVYCHWQKYSAKLKCSKNQFIQFENTVTMHIVNTHWLIVLRQKSRCAMAMRQIFLLTSDTSAYKHFQILIFLSRWKKFNKQPWTMSTKDWIPSIQQWFFITLFNNDKQFSVSRKNDHRPKNGQLKCETN